MAYIEQCLVPDDSNKGGQCRQIMPSFCSLDGDENALCGWYTNREPKTGGDAAVDL